MCSILSPGLQSLKYSLSDPLQSLLTLAPRIHTEVSPTLAVSPVSSWHSTGLAASSLSQQGWGGSGFLLGTQRCCLEEKKMADHRFPRPSQWWAAWESCSTPLSQLLSLAPFMKG